MLIFDLETDGLDINKITQIHVLTIYDYETDSYTRYDKERVKEGVKRLFSEAGMRIMSAY